MTRERHQNGGQQAKIMRILARIGSTVLDTGQWSASALRSVERGGH